MIFTPYLTDLISDHRQWRIRRMRNTGAPVSDQGGGSASTASTGSTASTATTPVTPPASGTGTPGTTPAAGSTPASPDTNAIQDGNWQQLRSKYDQVRTRAAILDSLGIPETELPDVAKAWTGFQTEVNSLAAELGYTDPADVAAAFKKDPIGTLNLLRKEKEEANSRSQTPQRSNESNVDYEARIAAEVAKQTKPYTDHINKQISDSVTAKIGTELTTAISAALPTAPPEIKSMVEDYVTEALTHDSSALVAMKARGDFSRVKEVTDLIAGRLTQGFAAWVKAEQTRTGGDGQPGSTSPTAPGTRRPTLDEMIDNPGLISSKYA